ncbi:kinase-like protein, partial [Trifolium medium]|nr:kinase-like protein [Trifolium medium]
ISPSKLAPERIELETLRRSTLSRPKPIPPDQPKWIPMETILLTLLLERFCTLAKESSIIVERGAALSPE